MLGKKEENERRLFFISDTWFYRENAIEILGRNYGSVDEMNDDLFEKWNMTVGEEDVVFILGNYVYDPTKIEIVNSMLRGTKVLLPTDFDKSVIMGNNDVVTALLTGETNGVINPADAMSSGNSAASDYIKYKAYDSVGLNTSDKCFGVLKSKLEAGVDDFILLHDNIVEMPGYGVVMSHYPLLEWNGKGRGVMSLHGGTVPTPKKLGEEMRFNVSADKCGMTPVSYENILKIMSKAR